MFLIKKKKILKFLIKINNLICIMYMKIQYENVCIYLQYVGNYFKELKKVMLNFLGNIGMFLEYGSKKVLK